MDFDGGIGGDQSEMWEWQSQEFDLQKDLVPAPSSSLWAEANQSVIDSWDMFDEQTPIKECTDIDLPFCDIVGDITIKDFDEGKETLQAKRRRMLQFCPENVEMECQMTDGLLESLQVDLDFSSDEHLLLTDGTEELPEEWLVDCSQDSVPGCPPAEMNSPPSASVQANISALQISLVEEQSNRIGKRPPQSRPTPLKAGRNIIRARKQKASVVAYPFELIKPCGFRGDTTLRDINQRIHSPPRTRSGTSTTTCPPCRTRHRPSPGSPWCTRRRSTPRGARAASPSPEREAKSPGLSRYIDDFVAKELCVCMMWLCCACLQHFTSVGLFVEGVMQLAATLGWW